MANIVELSRRGFVVVVLDLGGHGRSDVAINDYTKNPQDQNTEGVVAAVEYAMSLDCTDIDRVGTTGHSAGDLAIAYTVNWLNGKNEEGEFNSKNHIQAFFCPTGTISAMFVSSSTDLILGIASGKMDELDTYYFGTADFLGDPSIMSWNLLGAMVFIGLSGRYFYKKTGNAWAGALINASVVCLMAVTITRHTSDVMFGF